MGDPVAGAPAALPPEVQARLEKLEKDNAALGYKLRAWERLGKDAGEVIQYDPQGNPTGFNVEEDTPARPSPMAGGNGTHPLGTWLGAGDYSPVDSYYDGRYVSAKQYQKDLQQLYTQAMQSALANIHLFRGIDRTLTSKDYAELGTYDSPWAKRTAEVLQQKQWGRPLEGASSWDKWQYANTDAFQTAADIAMALMHKEGQAKQVADDAAKQAQAAAGLISGGGAGGVAGGPNPEGWKEKVGNDKGFNEMLKADMQKTLEGQMAGATAF